MDAMNTKRKTPKPKGLSKGHCEAALEGLVGHGLGRGGLLGGAAQLVAAAANWNYSEGLAVVAVVVVAGGLAAVSTFASAGVCQQAFTNGRAHDCSGLRCTSAYTPALVAVDALACVVVARADIGAAMDAKAGHLRHLRLLELACLAARDLLVQLRQCDAKCVTRLTAINGRQLADRGLHAGALFSNLGLGHARSLQLSNE